jgi:BolA family transcriptional regulator, general stress-responsive regulator
VAEPLAKQIRARLRALDALEESIEDESALHVGHAGAGDASHFRLRLVSPRFAGLGRLERHRLVYDCLSDLMPRQIHALAMTLLSPEEAAAQTHPTPRK